jgi:adenosylcobinamide-GDP ribazoletransferase
VAQSRGLGYLMGMAQWDGREFGTWQDEARLAVAFLTRLPLLGGARPEPGALARAAWAFPLAGILVGITGGIAFGIGDWLGLPINAMALLAVAVTALVTGGLHEDGLADTVDGLGGGADRETALAIMRDSRTGAFGVLALVFSVGLRVAALAALPDTRIAVSALLAAHTVSRGLLPTVMLWFEPARSDGLAAEAGRPSAPGATAAVLIGLLVALIMLGIGRALLATVLAGVAMMVVALLARRRIGGYTGDVLGAVQQVGEIVMLLAASI